MAAEVKTGILEEAVVKFDWVAPWSLVNSKNERLPSSREEAKKVLLENLEKEPDKIFTEWNLIDSTQIISKKETGKQRLVQRSYECDDTYSRGNDNGRLFRIVATADANIDSGLVNLDLSTEPEETNWNIINKHSTELIDIGDIKYSVQEVWNENGDLKDVETGESISDDRIWNIPKAEALDFLVEELKSGTGTYIVKEADVDTLKELTETLEEQFPGEKIKIETGSIGDKGVLLNLIVE